MLQSFQEVVGMSCSCASVIYAEAVDHDVYTAGNATIHPEAWRPALKLAAQLLKTDRVQTIAVPLKSSILFMSETIVSGIRGSCKWFAHRSSRGPTCASRAHIVCQRFSIRMDLLPMASLAQSRCSRSDV